MVEQAGVGLGCSQALCDFYFRAEGVEDQKSANFSGRVPNSCVIAPDSGGQIGRFDEAQAVNVINGGHADTGEPFPNGCF